MRPPQLNDLAGAIRLQFIEMLIGPYQPADASRGSSVARSGNDLERSGSSRRPKRAGSVNSESTVFTEIEVFAGPAGRVWPSRNWMRRPFACESEYQIGAR